MFTVPASVIFGLLATFSAAVQPGDEATTAARPALYTAEVVATYPHKYRVFTQGLFVADGQLYETSGQYGESAIIRHTAVGAREEAVRRLPDDVFGEGATVVDDTILTLTWRSGKVFAHSLEDLSPIKTFDIEGEGWGIAYDGTKLIVSDGTPNLRFYDPATFEKTGELEVKTNGRPLQKINELEWINGELWANIWQADIIARIDVESGNVTGFVNLAGLYRDPAEPNRNVLNGIAYDPEADRLFVTGKRWPEIFEIKVSAVE